MCQARPFPRCSNDGCKRRDKAKENFVEKKQRYEEHPTKENSDLYFNSEQRLIAANAVFYTTPAGLRELADEKAQLTEALRVAPEGNAGTRARRTYNKIRAELNMKTKMLDHWKESREFQTQDGKAAEIQSARATSLPEGTDTTGWTAEQISNAAALPHISERKVARSMARARGANVGRNAQPNYQQAFDEAIDNLPNADAYVNSLKEWDDNQLSRVNHWVEDGADPGWAASPVRKPTSITGEKVGGTNSRLIRLNTPDGQMVEGRADIMVVKKPTGKYSVVSSLKVSSSWEDAAPIDVTQQKLGHALSNHNGNHSMTHTEKEFDTLEEAERAAKGAKSVAGRDFKKSVAVIGRQQFINRIRNRSGRMQIRGWRAWPRYEKEDDN